MIYLFEYANLTNKNTKIKDGHDLGRAVSKSKEEYLVTRVCVCLAIGDEVEKVEGVIW